MGLLTLKGFNMNVMNRRVEITDEDWEDQRKAGRYNPAMVVSWVQDRKRRKMTLRAGRGDALRFYKEGKLFVVCAINVPLDYVGLQVYDTSCEVELEELFLQGPDQIESVLGKRWERKSDLGICKGLFHYWSEVFC